MYFPRRYRIFALALTPRIPSPASGRGVCSEHPGQYSLSLSQYSQRRKGSQEDKGVF